MAARSKCGRSRLKLCNHFRRKKGESVCTNILNVTYYTMTLYIYLICMLRGKIYAYTIIIMLSYLIIVQGVAGISERGPREASYH